MTSQEAEGMLILSILDTSEIDARPPSLRCCCCYIFLLDLGRFKNSFFIDCIVSSFLLGGSIIVSAIIVCFHCLFANLLCYHCLFANQMILLLFFTYLSPLLNFEIFKRITALIYLYMVDISCNTWEIMGAK